MLREDVVVIRGGVVPGDQRLLIEGENAQVVDAATKTSSVSAARPRGAAVGLVGLDRAAVKRDGRSAEGGGAVDVEASAQAVAAVAPRGPGAACGLVLKEVGVCQGGRHPEGGEQAAAQGVAARPA